MTNEIFNTGRTDHFGRPIYMNSNGVIYVDTEIDDSNPRIHAVCRNGEPEYPLSKREYTIVNKPTISDYKMKQIIRRRYGL